MNLRDYVEHNNTKASQQRIERLVRSGQAGPVILKSLAVASVLLVAQKALKRFTRAHHRLNEAELDMHEHMTSQQLAKAREALGQAQKEYASAKASVVSETNNA